MKISYDQPADVLYLTFEETKRRCEYVEENGIVLRIHPGTKIVVGCTIPRFSVQAVRGQLDIPFVDGTLIANLAGLGDRKTTIPA